MQLTLELQPGLTQQYKTLREITASAVNGTGRTAGLSNVAPALDMAPGDLGRKLAPRTEKAKRDGKRNLDIDDLVTIIQTTGDHRPILWLVEKFIPSDDQNRAAALDRLSSMVPEIAALLAAAGVPAKAAKR